MANNAVIMKYYEDLGNNEDRINFIVMLMDYDYDWYEENIEGLLMGYDDNVELDDDFDVMKLLGV